MTVHDNSSLPTTSNEPSVTITGSTLSQIESAVSLLSEDLGQDQLLHWLNLSAVLCERAKQIRQSVEQLAIAWISANGAIDSGDVRYTVGHSKVVHCLDVAACTRAVLEACGGDLAVLCECLHRDPY